MGMTNTTASMAAFLCAFALVGCGTDPYVGDSPSTKTDTATGTGTGLPTVTTTSTDTGSRTATVTTTMTTEGTATRTSLPTGTYTVTVTTTATMTIVEVVDEPDAGVVTPDAAVPDPSYPNIYIKVSPQRLLDLVVMIDNSPSMAPKVSKLNAGFPQMIAALRDPADGTLPDLRLAIIDSDLGTGCAYSAGSCGPKDPATNSECFGDQSKFRMLKFPVACTFNDGAQFLEYNRGAAVNYTGDISTVFACLAGNTGTMGCGFEHQLQAFEFALAIEGVGNEEQQAASSGAMPSSASFSSPTRTIAPGP